jgi:hypothetical protein
MGITIEQAQTRWLRLKERLGRLDSIDDLQERENMRTFLRKEIVALISDVEPLTRTGLDEDQAIAATILAAAKETLKGL